MNICAARDQGPSSAGMARHLAPFSCRQRMAEIVRRRSRGGVLPWGRHVSISGSSLIQCASASMAPPHPGGAKCYPGAEVQARTGPKCVVPESRGALSRDEEDALWQEFYTAAPAQRRVFEPSSKRRKKRPASSLPATD